MAVEYEGNYTGDSRLSVRGLRDSPYQWLRTLQDMARNPQIRRTCCPCLGVK